MGCCIDECQGSCSGYIFPFPSLTSPLLTDGVGQEAKGLGVHVLLGPVSGPLGKIPTGGRNWEGFSNDPYLSGIAMSEV